MRARQILVGAMALLALAAPACSERSGPTSATTSTASPSATGVSVLPDIAYYGNGPELDAYLPDPRPSSAIPAVIFVHGGGWAGGSRAEWGPWAMKLVKEQGWAAFDVDYRLDDSDPLSWPDEFLDLQAAVRFVAANAVAFDIDPKRIALLGESAGGNLSALVSSLGTTNSLTGSPAGASSAGQQVDGVTVAGQTLKYPATDLEVSTAAVALWSVPTELAPLDPPARGQSAPGCGADKVCAFAWDSGVIENYFGCSAIQCPQSYAAASPITHVSPTTSPTFVANAEEELVPLAQATEYAAALASAGVFNELKVVDGTLHAFQNADALWAPTITFLARYIDP
jgi:acetyl esterase/lipase